MNRKFSPTFQYNQKEVLIENITRYINKNKVKSVLDIGAGEGGVAIPISNHVKRYFAVEVNQQRANDLKKAGLGAVCGLFPNVVPKISGTFDMVLSSHSIPEQSDHSIPEQIKSKDHQLYRPFLENTWKLLNNGGVLLIITFKGSYDDPVRQIAEEVTGKKIKTHSDELYETMMEILKEFGGVKIERVNSYIATAEMSDLKVFFSRWFWEDDIQKNKYEIDFENAMKKHFKREGKYMVPTQHLFISVKK